MNNKTHLGLLQAAPSTQALLSFLCCLYGEMEHLCTVSVASVASLWLYRATELLTINIKISTQQPSLPACSSQSLYKCHTSLLVNIFAKTVL